MTRLMPRSHRFVAAVLGFAFVAACSEADSIDCADLANASSAACVRIGAPSFEGIGRVVPDAAGNLLITWQAAKDTATAADKMRYRIYVSRVEGRSRRQVPVETPPGATSAIVTAPLDEEVFILARAVNGAGVEDSNTKEVRVRASADRTAPTFEGLRSVVPVPGRGVKLEWGGAVDDLTPPELLQYTIFGAAGPVPDLSKPLVTTPAGATSVDIPKLGAPGETWSFAVIARDIAGNASTDRRVVSGALGADTEPPPFGGCGEATALGKAITLKWTPSLPPYEPPSSISVQLFLASSSGAQAFANPTATVASGASYQFTNLTPGTTYFFVCRAVNARGQSDGNTKEVSATISSDTTPPTFAGIKNSVFDAAARTVSLDWDPATDAVTAAADIVYEVYERTSTGTFGTAPRATSAPGATSIVVDDLTPESSLVWVVRARDAALNVDANAVEATGTTGTSYSRQVLPLLRRNCAVVGCHVSGFPTGGLSLSPAVAYGSLVNVPANQRPPGRPTPINRVTPGDPDESYLFRKIMGVAGTFVASPMPAPATGNVLSTAEKDLVKNWILAGALEN